MIVFKKNKISTGFSLIEVLTAMGILSAIVVMGLPTYNSFKENIVLKSHAIEIVDALRLSQNRSVISQDNLPHGVYFSSDSYTLFGGPWGSPSYTEERFLNSGVEVKQGAGTQIIFDRLNGATSPETIKIGTAKEEKVITVNELGKVTLED